MQLPPLGELTLRMAAFKRVQAARQATRPENLLEFIPRVSPKYTPPYHLKPYVDVLERSLREPVRAVFSAPPRHGKSETTIHHIVRCLKRDPTDLIGYATYAAEFSQRQSKKALLIAERAGGIQFAETRVDFWRTKQGGEVIWTSIGGPFTGMGVRKLLVDDPVKDRAEAESPTYRERAWEWFGDVALTRLEPGGSAVVMQTRWHPDDLAGRLIKEGWPRINLKAIDDAGRALWPERWSLEDLHKIRTGPGGEYSWASLYQGEPRSRGGAIFRDVRFYDRRPAAGYQLAIGVDLAYTAKKHADYSVAVVLAEIGGSYYVLDVVRQQVEAPQFANTLATLRDQYHGAKFYSYIGGTERGIIDFLKVQGVRIEAMPATEDKFVRAQPAAAAWNGGAVLLPRDAPWLDAFVAEVTEFTGVNDAHDDQVDALASAVAKFVGPKRARIEEGSGW